jgi:hypothetical protein
MPRFFLHLYNDLVASDLEGMELADVAAAREAAIVNIRDLMVEDLRLGHLVLHHRVEIADEGGRTLSVIHYRDAVTIEDQDRVNLH